MIFKATVAARNSFPAMADEIERLRAALTEARDCLLKPQPGIADTIWFSDIETLVDRIDAAPGEAR